MFEEGAIIWRILMFALLVACVISFWGVGVEGFAQHPTLLLLRI